MTLKHTHTAIAIMLSTLSAQKLEKYFTKFSTAVEVKLKFATITASILWSAKPSRIY